MTILLVRHGETAGNAARVIQRPEIPLNPRGIRQAARLADRLCSLGFAHVVCSDLLRARMTAEPLRACGDVSARGDMSARGHASAQGHASARGHMSARGRAIEETPLLEERSFGDLRGTPYAELTVDPFAPDYVPPNGESVEAFHRRVAQAFALIVERRRGLPGALVVVTHGLVIRALLANHARTTGLPDHLANASLTILDPDPPFTARLVNCTQHLEGELEEPRAIAAEDPVR
jgi:probable phosphoglycerate mutase